MSSFHKAIHRRNHRERAQPAARDKWGLLEKRKDYSLRAKDYNEKKKRLRILRQKVAQRHPEEFNFGMIRSRMDDKGRRVADRKVISLSQDSAKLLKTQDAGYLNMLAQKTSVAKNKLEQEYLMQKAIDMERKSGEQPLSRSHHKFILPADLKVLLPSTSKQHGETSSNRSRERTSRLSSGLPKLGLVSDAEINLRGTWEREQKLRESKLKLLRQRQREICAASEALGQQRAKMANNVGGVTTAGFKWKVRERHK